MSPRNITVDDVDPSIVYTPAGNWQHVSNLTTEYDGTRSGAAFAGMTATFNFTGQQVFVYGSQGSIDVYGQPVTTYIIDGNSALASTYQAPYIAPGYYTVHTLFFASPLLAPGSHQLLITNINGTAPSIFWLDDIIYTVDPDTLPASSSSLPSSSITPSLSSSSSTSLPPTTSSAPSAPLNNNDDSKTSSPNTGAIVGGVIGGVALMAAIIIAWLFYRRRGGRDLDLGDETPPSKEWEGTPTPYILGTSGDQPPFDPTDLRMPSSASIPASSTTMLPATTTYTGGTSESSQLAGQRTGKRVPAPPPVIAQHEDSGLRVPGSSMSSPLPSSPPATVTDVPPAYSSL